MKTILCYGDSNVWGNIPGSFNEKTGLSERYNKNKRWTGVLQKTLGEKYNVVEEGLNARTTTLDEIIPGRPYKNGLTQLPFCLEAHYPIDLIIFLLGINDLKIQFNRSAKEITEGMRQLIKVVKKSNKGHAANSPNILLLSPAPVIKIPNLHPQFDDDSIEKSKNLAGLYQQMAKEEDVDFLDISLVVTPSRIDGIHFKESQCKLLGQAIAEKVNQLSQD